jgi:hypothetical protein
MSCATSKALRAAESTACSGPELAVRCWCRRRCWSAARTAVLFVHTFVDCQAPTNPVLKYDLYISSMSLVKLLKNGRNAAYPDLPWEPKQAFRAVADYYAER